MIQHEAFKTTEEALTAYKSAKTNSAKHRVSCHAEYELTKVEFEAFKSALRAESL